MPEILQSGIVPNRPLKRLDEQFQFTPKTPILNNLNRLLIALEARMAELEKLKLDTKAELDAIMAVALSRMDETFTPLIEDAQARLEQFGVAFTAHSSSSVTIGTGAKVFVIDEEDRGAFAFADFCAIRHVGGVQLMTAQVNSFDRETGQLFVTVVITQGTGTFADWDIRLAAEPDVGHQTDFNNPHNVTAAQVGSYTIEEADEMRQNAIDTTLQRASNLSDLLSSAAARANLGLGGAATRDVGTNTANNEVASWADVYDLVRRTRWIG